MSRGNLIGLLLLLPLLGWKVDDDAISVYTVKITNHASNAGLIRLGVYDKSEAFPVERQQFRGLINTCESKCVEFKVILPKGKKYAFAAYHDANSNSVLDKNMLGMPIERYGFSNGVRGFFSAPSFDEAMVVDNSKEVLIRLE